MGKGKSINIRTFAVDGNRCRQHYIVVGVISGMKRSRLWYFIFIFPVLAAFLMVVIIPTCMGIYYSFTSWNGIENNAALVGLKNYTEIFKNDPDFLKALFFTVRFTLAAVIGVNAVGFSLALLVTKGFKGSNLLRGIFFMPNLIGGILLGFTWQFIFINAFDSIGKALNVEWLQGWLSTSATGFWGMVIVIVWQLSGYMMIIYIAAIQNIPDSVVEAAQIDGAGGLVRLAKITIPLVAPAFTIGLFLSLSNSFKLFDQNISLTAGGPFRSTEMLALNIYNTAFQANKLGLAQAKAVVFLIFVSIISLTQLYFSKRKELEM